MAGVRDEMAASPGDAHPETETLNPRARARARAGWIVWCTRAAARARAQRQPSAARGWGEEPWRDAARGVANKTTVSQ